VAQLSRALTSDSWVFKVYFYSSSSIYLVCFREVEKVMVAQLSRALRANNLSEVWQGFGFF
jgi:hypothetical protein